MAPLLVGIGFAALLAGCPQGDNTIEPTECFDHASCPGTELCVDGVCTEPGEDCQTDDDCPGELRCVPETGNCRSDVECVDNSECCPPEGECSATCENFQCVGSECNPGETRPCFVGCHRGESACTQGTWELCDAPPVLDHEVCDDQIDNDCNGETDERCDLCTPDETRPCTASCDEEGEQVCGQDEEWGECSAEAECSCEPGQTRTRPCGNCGYVEDTCSPTGEWLEGSVCMGEGECEAGAEDYQECGNCGTQIRACTDECTWNAWSECLGPPDACAPGAEEQQGCGVCGSQTRTCQSGCAWSDWSTCDEDAGCYPGQEQVQECGLCGERVSVCDGSCGWGPFGECQDEGVCSPGEVETEACNDCGQRDRVCGDDCQWGAWSGCSSQGTCSPGDTETQDCGPPTEVGICEKGERTRTCNSNCLWNPYGTCFGATYSTSEVCGDGIDQDCDGSDYVQPDDYEPNDSCGNCYSLGTDPDNVTIYPTFHANSDGADYFCFYGDDGGWDPTENISVSVTNIPTGQDLDLFLYKGIDDCNSKSNALDSSVTIGGNDEEVSWGESVGGNDDSWYYVRVEHYDDTSCFQTYTLNVHGLR